MKKSILTLEAKARPIINGIHLATLAKRGFPASEAATAVVHAGAGRGALATWHWDAGTKSNHLDFYPDAMPRVAPDACVSMARFSRAWRMLYEHERGHAIFTERNPKATRALLEGHKQPIPFQVLNVLEDCRIERHMHVRLGVKFDWKGIFPAPSAMAPVAGPCPINPWELVNMIIAIKMEINKIPATVSRFIHRGTINKIWARVKCSSPSLFRGVNAFEPLFPGSGYEGDTWDLIRFIGLFTLQDSTVKAANMVLGIMADKFPMPAAPPPDGVSPTPGGIEDGEGDMTPHGEEYTEGSDDSTPSGGASSDEINDVAKSEKEAGDASERVAGADGKAKGKSASNKPREVRHKSLRPANHAQDAEIESTDYSTLNSDGTWRDNYDPSNGGAGAYDRDGSEAFSVLRSAFPGAGRTFSTNPNGEPSIERWISRQPEMFQRRHDTGGRKGDVILIIDGSGSMDGRWQGYGHSITAGLIRCYRAGMLSRLRIILTQKSKLLVNENPEIGWADGVMTHGGTEGLDAAYRYIEREGWVDNPSVTTLVITDGDITDDVPCLRRCHAAGIYPVGAYVGNHSSVERVKAYFDHFITRTTPSALLAEITRIL